MNLFFLLQVRSTSFQKGTLTILRYAVCAQRACKGIKGGGHTSNNCLGTLISDPGVVGPAGRLPLNKELVGENSVSAPSQLGKTLVN
jgi:hypothetical protein